MSSNSRNTQSNGRFVQPFLHIPMNIPISHYKNFAAAIPAGDTHERMVCNQCDWVHYENPRIIVTALCRRDNEVLLCRRAIAPRYGFWTLPGGFMEVGETTEHGACREVREEANADVSTTSLLATYTVPRIGQVHLVYLAKMNTDEFFAGDESLDVRWFPLNEESIPWDDLAFPVNHWALRDYLSLNGRDISQPFSTRQEHVTDRMSPVEYHPDFPPPATQT